MHNIALIGANGGIGRALMRWCSEHWSTATIWATYRTSFDNDRADAPNIRWLPLDLASDPSITQFATTLNDATHSLDLLVFCSGWLHDNDHMPEKSLRDLSSAAFDKALRINATGPLLLTAKLSDLLTRKPGSNAARSKVVMLSAKVGSIEDNSLGGWHAYRMSKAALNMGVRNLGIEFARNKRKPLVVAVHPGTTDTALSKPFAKRGLNVVDAKLAAERLGQFIVQVTEEDQGGFFHWDGSKIDW